MPTIVRPILPFTSDFGGGNINHIGAKTKVVGVWAFDVMNHLFVGVFPQSQIASNCTQHYWELRSWEGGKGFIRVLKKNLNMFTGLIRVYTQEKFSLNFRRPEIKFFLP